MISLIQRTWNRRSNAGSCILVLITVCLLSKSGIAQTNAEIIRDADWYERTIAQGVVAKSYQFDNLFNSRQTIYVLEADMNVAGVGIELPFRQDGTRRTVPAFAGTITGATASVNGNFFNSAGSVQFLRVNGSAVANTLPGAADAGGIAVTAGGDLRALARPTSGWASLADPNVMATNIPVMIGGARYPFPSGNFYTVDRHPRTVIGVTQSNRLLMVVIDGRSSTAAGMTFVELFETMQALDAHDAVNMDGGGSSTMWDADTPGSGISNMPSDGPPRAVANSVVLVAPPLAVAPPAFDARRAFAGNNASPHQAINVMVESGDPVSVNLGFINRGTTTWSASNTFLGTTEARNRNSVIFDPSQWINASTVGTFTGGPILPGQVGYFPVKFVAPTVNVPTSFRESFGLRTSEGLFFGPEQNRIHLTIMPKTDAEIVVESRRPDGGLNTLNYSESPALANTTSKSSVTDPPVFSTGARYNAIVNSTAVFTPNIVSAGTYNLYVTMGAGSNNNAVASYNITRPAGNLSGVVHLVYTDLALVNQWKLLAAEVVLPAGTQSSITFTNTNGDNASGRRFVMDAVRFSRLANSQVADWSIY